MEPGRTTIRAFMSALITCRLAIARIGLREPLIHRPPGSNVNVFVSYKPEKGGDAMVKSYSTRPCRWVRTVLSKR